jgi:sugar (pentulose or hexulose) kinase
MTHAQLTELALQPENEQPGCSGVNFLPYLVGERTPNWPQATGALLGLTPGVYVCVYVCVCVSLCVCMCDCLCV